MALAAVETVAEKRPGPKAVEAAISALAAKFGNRLVTSQAVREQHGNILTWIANQPPDAVVFPQSTDDVQDAVRICALHKMPVVPFGTGTSLEGHINAPFGGVTIDFRDMNRILAVHADLDCVVEPASPQAIERVSARPGLFFPIDPRPTPRWRHVGDAGLGHQRGALRDDEGQRTGAQVVLATGEIISTSRRAKNLRPATISPACSSARKARSASSPR